MIQTGVRVSITTDEYTSLKIARHCCVNIHLPGEHIGLGMIQITGKFTAERAAETLRKKLREFDMEDGSLTVAGTTDGARFVFLNSYDKQKIKFKFYLLLLSVMTKMGRIMEWIHQLCHAHGNNHEKYNLSYICISFIPGIHLAVCSIVYERRTTENDENEEVDYEVSSEDETMSEGEEHDLGWSEEGQDDSYNPTFAEDLRTGIKKVSKIVAMFRRSPKLWERLLARTKEELGEQLGLKFQSKTR